MIAYLYTYIQYIKYTDIWFYERPPGESSIHPMESQRIGNTTPSVAGPRAQSRRFSETKSGIASGDV